MKNDDLGYRLNVWVPPKFICGHPIFNVTVLGGGPLGDDEAMKEEPYEWG